MPTLDGKDVKITVDNTCTACGQCAQICPSEYLLVTDDHASERSDAAFGCITCGQCAAICPTGAIHVEAEGIGRDDVFEFSGVQLPMYGELYRLLCGRRSIRAFTDKPVPEGDVKKILEAAQQAPAGLPPSSVEVLVLEGPGRVKTFAFDFLDEVEKMAWLFSKWGIWALRPFMSADYHREMRKKIAPLYRGLLAGRKLDRDYLFYDAPLAMIFLGKGDPVDPTIAATYAMVAAETMSLGSCMIGTVTPMLYSTGAAFRKKYAVSQPKKEGLAIVFGYPKFKFQRAVRRRFAAVVRTGGEEKI